ncbi:MAG TPA: bifunctional glutamate N-acetyltransferase/amino-acid acetyltransferase ArgJ [Mycobacteriales bacterium]|nr:bifunctional glutamate N-acetyltransferase/amino-acid acetyltransferase ArgJ [Mycobacteriales bacterium]
MSVTAAQGFRAAGVIAGLKASGRPDVALVVNDGPSRAAAGVFTRNRVVAAAVPWSKQVLADGQVQVVVLNSGGANAFTGPQGFLDVHTTAERAAAVTGASAADVAVCQTGLIGVPLPMPLLLAGVDAAAQALSVDGGPAAAEAIMTTDSVRKQAVVTGEGWTVGGMAKGAGMIAPALATMLVVITTDAVAEPAVLDRVLRAATAVTFDRVDVDGCISTNDTVLLLASGASRIAPEEAELAAAVHSVCAQLAGQIVADAEGASKQVRVDVIHAHDEADALAVARAVARNALVKCALAGSDPNWGRVAAAVGSTDAAFDPDHLDIAMNGVWVCRDSGPAADPSTADLSARDVTVTIDLRAGDASGWVWTTDLTEAYVHENSAYST